MFTIHNDFYRIFYKCSDDKMWVHLLNFSLAYSFLKLVEHGRVRIKAPMLFRQERGNTLATASRQKFLCSEISRSFVRAPSLVQAYDTIETRNSEVNAAKIFSRKSESLTFLTKLFPLPPVPLSWDIAKGLKHVMKIVPPNSTWSLTACGSVFSYLKIIPSHYDPGNNGCPVDLRSTPFVSRRWPCISTWDLLSNT